MYKKSQQYLIYELPDCTLCWGILTKFSAIIYYIPIRNGGHVMRRTVFRCCSTVRQLIKIMLVCTLFQFDHKHIMQIQNK